MASPSISNRRPDEGDTDVSISTPFRFGIRDTDTRADLSSAYAAIVYAKAFYVPDEVLPALDTTLAAADTSLVFSMFDDASGAVNPGNPCDQTVEAVGPETVYRIEKSDVDGSAQEGMLYVSVPAQDTVGPCAFKATLDLAAVTPAATYTYTTHVDFVGVVVGLVYWAENTGIFLLFRDDGTKRISIVGPSTDGVGTRSVETSVVYDWSVPSTYTIFVDPTPFRRSAMVYATDTTGTETLLGEVDLDTLNEFLPTVRMGSLYAEDSPNYVTGVLGLDSTNQGDYLDVYGFQLAGFGRVLLAAGNQTGSSAVETLPTEAILVVGSEGAEEWSSSTDLVDEATSTAYHITATSGPALKTREEPDLSAGAWMLLGGFTARNSVHIGSYATGMGFVVRDGTRTIKLALLDDYTSPTIGVEDSVEGVDTAVDGYVVPVTSVDWEEDVPFTFLGSAGARDAVRVFVGSDDEVPVIDTPYASAGFAATTETAVSFGFIETADVSGDFYLTSLWLFPNCTFYEGYEATYPDTQGWTRSAGGGTRALDTNAFSTTCTAVGAYDIYSITDATYDATSGAAVLFKARVTAWTDTSGATSPPRSEFGPIAAIRTTTVAAQVRFVVADDGTAYVFLSNEESDYLDVLAQNSTGSAISAEIDLDVAHVYLLDVKPFNHIRLYLDYATTPAIDMAWPASGALRALPTNMPVDAVVAFGSLNEDAGVACSFAFARGSIGRGYDFKITTDVTESELQDHVYGSVADLVIDVQDED